MFRKLVLSYNKVSLLLLGGMCLFFISLNSSSHTFSKKSNPQNIIDVAQPFYKPQGIPRYSDVSMRLFSIRDDVTADRIIQAGQDFHITRGDWSYIRDPAFIERVRQLGWTFQGSIHAITANKNYALKDKEGNPLRDHFNVPSRYIADPQNSDYRKWYLNELKQWFALGVDSMQRDEPNGLGKWPEEDATDFFKDIHSKLDSYLGRRVSWSVNSSGDNSLLSEDRETGTQLFDFIMAEMKESENRPSFFRQSSKNARQQNKTFVHTTGQALRVADYRRAIAGAYANGINFIVPWDQYVWPDEDRVFSKPEDLADLYGFVRANAAYLDGYEDAAVVGYELKDKRWPNAPVRLRGDDKVSAWVRAKPNQRKQAIVIHLTDWDDPDNFVVMLRKSNFFEGEPLKVKLLIPLPYNQELHTRAEQSKNYAPLSKEIFLPVTDNGDWHQVEIPGVMPWGILVVEKL